MASSGNPIPRRAVLLAAAALPCAATAFAQTGMPPLTSPPTQDHIAGKMVYARLVTPDIAAAGQFYTALLGWQMQPMRFGTTSYAVATMAGQPIAGFLQRDAAPGSQPHPLWISFFSAPDVDAAAATAAQHGAKTLFEPHTIPGFGREAILADPQGAIFGILASSSGDPADTLSPVGSWIWSSLIATDPDADAAFYQTVLGYDVFDLPGRSDAQHFILASHDASRASVNPLPQNATHPNWVSYVRVADTAATAAQITKLGGQIIVQPVTDRHGGKLAIAADPQGALFGVMDWSETATGGARR